MLIRETKALLASMLDDAGIDPSAVTVVGVRTVVEVFRRFAAFAVDDSAAPADDGDAVLAQFGTHDLRGQREFSADLTRQFVEIGGERAPMWQVSCTLYWAPSAATDILAAGHLWSFGMTLDEFFAQVAALPGWRWALNGVHAPRDLVITLGEI
jgi:hypothetical protein